MDEDKEKVQKIAKEIIEPALQKALKSDAMVRGIASGSRQRSCELLMVVYWLI